MQWLKSFCTITAAPGNKGEKTYKCTISVYYFDICTFSTMNSDYPSCKINEKGRTGMRTKGYLPQATISDDPKYVTWSL